MKVQAPVTLYKYILKEVAFPFVGAVFVLSFVALMPQMLRIAEKVLAFGVTIQGVFQVIGYVLPTVLLFVVPASFLLAILIAFGRLSADSEMIAIRAAGVSLWQLLPPVLALGLAASAATAFMSNFGEPWGRHGLKLFIFDLGREKAAGLLRERTFNDDFFGKVVYADSVIAKQGVLQNVFLSDETDPQNSYAIMARLGRVYSDPDKHAIIVHLENGSVDHFMPDTEAPAAAQSVSRLYFDKLDININPDTSLHAPGKDPYDMYPGELYAKLSDPKSQATGRDWMAFHKKFAYPISALLIGVIGMALGISDPRHGKGKGYALGLIAMILYYLLVRIGDATGEKQTVPPWIAAWAPNLVFAAIGFWLMAARAREQETFIERLWNKVVA